MTRSNVAVGGHSSSNFGNLALVGHKKKNRASKKMLPSLSGHVTGFSTASSRKAKSVARGNHTQYTNNSQNLNIIDKYQSIDEQIDAIVRKNNNRSAIDLQNFKNQQYNTIIPDEKTPNFTDTTHQNQNLFHERKLTVDADAEEILDYSEQILRKYMNQDNQSQSISNFDQNQNSTS
jgi:hypothetical protein